MWVKEWSAGAFLCSISLVVACSSDSTSGSKDGGLDGSSSSGGSSGSGNGGAAGKGTGGASGSGTGGHAGLGSGGNSGSATGGSSAGGASAGGSKGTDAGTPDASGDAGATPCGSCKAGELCVEHLLEGGAVFVADAGRCPPGRVLAPGGPGGAGICVQPPSYACEVLPSACGSATAHCTCARSLCGSANLCEDVSPAFMRCTLQAP